MNDGPMEVLSREDRLLRFGVDCRSVVLWKGGTWAPGGMYIYIYILCDLSLDFAFALYVRIESTSSFT